MQFLGFSQTKGYFWLIFNFFDSNLEYHGKVSALDNYNKFFLVQLRPYLKTDHFEKEVEIKLEVKYLSQQMLKQGLIQSPKREERSFTKVYKSKCKKKVMACKTFNIAYNPSIQFKGIHDLQLSSAISKSQQEVISHFEVIVSFSPYFSRFSFLRFLCLFWFVFRFFSLFL